ncbi:TetR family transcriptional regulator protein [Tolypothrix sp. NIES-4075]|uniref:TetR/AcrR family transcriptional regulator n=1 Tax=Tolypothrix sp. NIES-4075 TaxID=2005459 RepID=UPI000B5CC6AA|nr:TetR/AcrR family transcriptional regulator [Tolypothrix sp. NIES-4075]GAX40357.1 TetR family transcriptional regulator protein [Tolypothrix sp. NIES-4075]
MSKGEETKEKILLSAAELFNQQGYAGSSISDIMRVTGLQKGGIYNHFKSKDELALLAFDYAIAQITGHYRVALRSKRHAIERLQAIIDVFRSNIDNPTIKGGCPLLNTAVESDDTHPALRDRAQQAMNSWRDMICRIIQKGIEKGEIRSDVDADEVATIIISTLEGAVMMSKLYEDSIHLKRAVNHLNQYIKSLC